MPERAVSYATLIELYAFEQHALGEHVWHVNNEAGCGRADIDMMRGVGRKADQLALIIDRRDGGDVGRVAGAVIGVVVDHHIARLPGIVQGFVDAA